MSTKKQWKKAQEDILLHYLSQNANTAYGREHHFSQIRSVDDYVAKHKITSYKDYQPYVQRILQGERTVLTKDEPVFTALTSGTTGLYKEFPLIKRFKLSMVLTASAIYFKVYSLFKFTLGRILVLRLNPKTRTTATGGPMGSVSSFLGRIQELPMYVTPTAWLKIHDEQTILYVHALFGLADKHVQLIDGFAAPLVHSFFKTIEKNADRLCDDIEFGRIDPALSIDSDVRKSLNENLRPNPQRAAELRQEFSNGFCGIAKRVWPDMEFNFFISTGSFRHYTSHLEGHYTKGLTNFSGVHMASEGFIGLVLPTAVERPPVYHLVPSTFYEFIPIDKSYQDQPDTLFAEQVCNIIQQIYLIW